MNTLSYLSETGGPLRSSSNYECAVSQGYCQVMTPHTRDGHCTASYGNPDQIPTTHKLSMILFITVNSHPP